jgi:phosphoglycerol transferase
MYENGKNPEVAMRSPIESEIYGLKIAQLLMPISGHRIPRLAIVPNYYNKAAPLVNENQMASLGLIGSLGFLILIVWILYLIGNGINFKEYYILDNLSIFNLYGLLLATIGGFGTVFAGLAFPEIRCYNRISIFIAFFSLFAVVLLLEEFSKRYVRGNTPRLLFNAFLCLALAVGVSDQTSESFVPPYDSIRAEYLNDDAFIKNIEAIMPENAMIFQLPYVPFPEYPPVYKMDDYSHFRAYLHSKDLRWSYGTIKPTFRTFSSSRNNFCIPSLAVQEL